MMTPTEMRDWAKEEVLAGVDERVKALLDDPVNGPSCVDEENALKLQRDRVAQFLGLEAGKRAGKRRRRDG